MQNAKHTLARKSANLEAESISDSASRFPFPTRALALKELSWDRYVMRIPEEDKERIVDLAWSKGERAAHMVFEESNGQSDFFQICKDVLIAYMEISAISVITFLVQKKSHSMSSHARCGQNKINLICMKLKISY